MPNAYATDWIGRNRYGNPAYHGIHVFGSRAERDAWTAADPDREPVPADDAEFQARFDQICYLHDGARLPKSWDTDRCWWDQGRHSATLQDFRRWSR